MIEIKDLTEVEQHLTNLGLRYIKSTHPRGQAYWVLPDTWDDSKRCPFAIVVNPVGWHYDFYLRVCNKYFRVDTAQFILGISHDKLNILVDRANESEFQIAKVQKTTVEIVTTLVGGCVNVE